MLADLSAACLWLLRREVRRLDRACAGVEELRDAMRTGLRTAGLAELQALLAAPTRRARDAAGGALKGSGPRLHTSTSRGRRGVDQKIARRPPPTPLANFREGC